MEIKGEVTKRDRLISMVLEWMLILGTLLAIGWILIAL